VWLIPLPRARSRSASSRTRAFTRSSASTRWTRRWSWLAEYEPQLAQALEGRRDQIEDFLRVEDFAMGCSHQFSAERWCLVGEAGAFADPFYSPGSDYIAIGNTFATDLIARDLDGEDIGARAEAPSSASSGCSRHAQLLRGPVRNLAQRAGDEREDHRRLLLLLGVHRAAVLPPQADRSRVHGRECSRWSTARCA
jgi:hypothetical protein